jgi:hypothetical protein
MFSITNTKAAILSFLLIGLISRVNGQSIERTAKSTITMQDLRPDINYSNSKPFYHAVQEKSGYAFLSSAIIPGSGQAANKKWLRAGLYFVAEAILAGIRFKSYHDAKVEERRYLRFVDNHWSVVNYAKWLVNYYDHNNLDNTYINKLRNQISGIQASYDPQTDWQKVDIELLRKIERNTPYVFPDNEIGNMFSHEMPDYGSQQYYELISKYYQYGVGWIDFGNDRNGNTLNNLYSLSWDGGDMPYNFFHGAALAEDFNDSYRLAGNMLSFLILNHIISAFDAYLTVKVKNSRIEANANLMNLHQTFILQYHF